MPKDAEMNFVDSLEKFRMMLDPKEIIRGQVKLCSIYFSSQTFNSFIAATEILENMLPDIEDDKRYTEVIREEMDKLREDEDRDLNNLKIYYSTDHITADQKNEIVEKYRFILYQLKFKHIIKHMQSHNLWLDKELTRKVMDENDYIEFEEEDAETQE